MRPLLLLFTLGTSVVTSIGDAIILCLEAMLGLSRPGDPCLVPVRACVGQLQVLPGCANISELNGTAIFSEVPTCICSAELGLSKYNPSVSSCLSPDGIGASTLGTDVVSCLYDALAGRCIYCNENSERLRCARGTGSFTTGGVTGRVELCILELGTLATRVGTCTILRTCNWPGIP